MKIKSSEYRGIGVSLFLVGMVLLIHSAKFLDVRVDATDLQTWTNLPTYRGLTVQLTNGLGTNFLTIKRPFVRFNGSVLVRLTDEEWRIITNHYPDKIVNEPLLFYK